MPALNRFLTKSQAFAVSLTELATPLGGARWPRRPSEVGDDPRRIPLLVREGFGRLLLAGQAILKRVGGAPYRSPGRFRDPTEIGSQWGHEWATRW